MFSFIYKRHTIVEGRWQLIIEIQTSHSLDATEDTLHKQTYIFKVVEYTQNHLYKSQNLEDTIFKILYKLAPNNTTI